MPGATTGTSEAALSKRMRKLNVGSPVLKGSRVAGDAREVPRLAAIPMLLSCPRHFIAIRQRKLRPRIVHFLLSPEELRALASTTLLTRLTPSLAIARAITMLATVEVWLRISRKGPYTILDFGCGQKPHLSHSGKLGQEALDGLCLQLFKWHAIPQGVIFYIRFLAWIFRRVSPKLHSFCPNPGVKRECSGAFELPRVEWGALHSNPHRPMRVIVTRYCFLDHAEWRVLWFGRLMVGAYYRPLEDPGN